MKHHLETKFNISSNSTRSEDEQILVFHSEFRVYKCDVYGKTFFPVSTRSVLLSRKKSRV